MEHETEILSVDEAIERIGIGRFHIKISFLVLLYGFIESQDIVALTYSGSRLQCEWFITNFQMSVYSGSMLWGSIVGLLVISILADRFGRKPATVLTVLFYSYFALLSLLSPTYAWLVTLRSLCGVAIGGAITLNMVIFTEFTPSHSRGLPFIITNFAWLLGSLWSTGMAFLVNHILQWPWQWYQFCCQFPLIVLLLLSLLWLPESPQQLVLEGRIGTAKLLLDRIARDNGTEPLNCHIIGPDEIIRPGSISSMKSHTRGFKKNRKFALAALLITVIQFVDVFVLYAASYLNASLYLVEGGCAKTLTGSHKPTVLSRANPHPAECCLPLPRHAYIHSMLGLLIQSVSVLATYLLMEICGRKTSIGVNLLLVTGCFMAFQICMPHLGEVAVVTTLNILITTAGNFHSLYACELFPTSFRSFGFGLSGSVARIGVVLVPVLIFSIMPLNRRVALAIMSGMCAMGAVCAFLLPVETKNRPLAQTFEEEVETENAADADATDSNVDESLTATPSSVNYDTFTFDDFKTGRKRK